MELNRQSSPEEVFGFLEDWFNTFESPIIKGQKVGKLFLDNSHRTVQGAFVNFLLSTMYTMAEEKYTDPRNKEAIELCQITKKATGERYQHLI